MSKRAREDESGLQAISTGALSVQARDAVIKSCTDVLFQSLKLARGFERQKLGRRQKAAKAADDAVNIQSKINEFLISKDTPTANVQARLFNSQPMKKAMVHVMKAMYAVTGLEKLRDSKRRRIRASDYQRDQNGRDDENTKAGATGESDNRPKSGATSRFDTNNEVPHESNSEEEDIDPRDYHYPAVISSAEPTADDFESFDTDSYKTSSEDMSVSPSPLPRIESARTKAPQSPSVRAHDRSSVNASSTTFLPSLTMGGYWSGSEAADDEDVDSPIEEVRRNRRGQRERRMIAEKKYGKNAKHLKRQASGRERDHGWDPRRGAQAEEEENTRGRSRVRRPIVSQKQGSTKTGVGSSTGANSDPVGQRKGIGKGKPANEALHPSWQAAKSAKEQKKAVVFQGKRMVFD
ncbi:MAG: hypothetical protein Q9220_000448 [cf. Caloplaca sp. 1 TL-2023]